MKKSSVSFGIGEYRLFTGSFLFSVILIFFVFCGASAQIWEDFTVWYDGNGADSGNISREKYSSGTNEITLKMNAADGNSDVPYVKSGCRFQGWCLYPEGSFAIAPILPGGSVWEPVDVPVTWMENENGFVFYARWDCSSYTVTYDGNGADGGKLNLQIASKNSIVSVKDENGIAGDAAIYRNGYVFTGWNTKADGTGMGVVPGSELTLDSDYHLYAMWVPVPTATSELPTETPTSLPTDTPEPTATSTAVPTNTLVPTATNTAVPTNTFVPTATSTAVPTATAFPVVVNTLVPTETSVPDEPLVISPESETIVTDPVSVPTETAVEMMEPTATAPLLMLAPPRQKTEVPAPEMTEESEPTATDVPTPVPQVLVIPQLESQPVNPANPEILSLNNTTEAVTDTDFRRSSQRQEGSVPANFTTEIADLVTLPKTGITTQSGFLRSMKPASVSYKPTYMELQIPVLNLISNIVSVESTEEGYPIEWLEMDTGLLADTALPGQGFSVLAAHNTLDAETFGPFALISTMETGDRLFVRTEDNGLMIFEVYSNQKISEYDYEALYKAGYQFDNTITLLTCEDERPEGGYANRRIVSARLLH